MDYLRRIANISLIPFILLAFVGLTPIAANAATTTGTPNGFTVSPVITEITINKGQSEVVNVSVTNPSTGILVATPVVNDFVANSDESGTPDVILKSNTPLPANNFISLVQPMSSVTLQSHQQATIPVTITVPADANSGGYYGVVRFVPGNLNTKGGNVGLSASVGSLFVITVPGNLTEKLSIIQLSAEKNGTLGSLFFSGALSVVTRIQNDGNIQSAPFGNVVIKNSSGKIVTSFQLNQETPRGLVLPGSIRKFTNNINYSHWFGHYTIIANLGYGSGGNLITSTASFWYIPVWSIVVAVIIVIAVVSLLYWLINKGKDSKFNK